MAGPTHDHPEGAAPTPDAPGRAAALDLGRPVAGTTGYTASGHTQRQASDPTPVDLAPRRDRLTRRRTLALQRSAGNRAVSGLLRHIQRVPVKEARGETLYNEQDASGKATAKRFGAGKQANYELTRSGDSGVTVTVRVQFVSQARNTVPKPAGAPPGTPDLGDLIDEPSEIPADDPRRAWATTVIEDGVKIWNGRLTLVGEEWNLSGENTRKRLPVTFRAEPVFGLGEAYDNRIVVHPPAIVAGSPGHKIDAGNYYMNKGGYTGDEKIITAHEYGHLLGIDDEYSQSNEMLNGLLHDAAPDGAPSLGKALDRATVERMVLVSLKSPMLQQLDAAMPQLVVAIQAQRKLVKARMATAARAAVVSSDVRTQLRDQLAARSSASVSSSIPQVVAFQTTSNFSNVTHAGTGVDAGFSSAALSTQVRDAYWQALTDASGRNITLKGLGDVSVDVHGAVPATTASGGANAASATGVATSTVGPLAAPAGGAGGATGGGGGASGGGASAGGTPGLPAINPPATLIDKLSALPATWSAAGSAVETGITPDKYAAKMVGTLKAAQAVAAVASLVGIGDIGTTSALYQEAYALVTSAARTASQELATELIGTTMTPVLTTGVSDLESAIGTEVAKVMGTPASGVTGLGTPDPNMTALVGAMKARLDADKAATAGGGRDPLGKSGGTAPAQDVTYSYQGLMGSNATAAMRPDQFNPMLKQFNDRLTTTFEKTFTAEVK